MNGTIPLDDPRIDRNPNGSWWCSQCRMILIIWSDDPQEHDCTGKPWWEES